MKLVVGLGNPGPRYADTRHNVGFQLIDGLARRWTTAADRYERRFEALLGEAQHGAQRVLLCKPVTFMNLSGQSVLALTQFYKISHGDVLVASDDMDLPPGRLRIRPDGSAGGQKGLADILRRLGTQDVARLRIGIGRPAYGSVDHVLSQFTTEERTTIEAVLLAAAEAVECWLSDGVEAAMNRFNAWKFE